MVRDPCGERVECNGRPVGTEHSAWDLLEHGRSQYLSHWRVDVFASVAGVLEKLEQPFGWWLHALDAEVDYCLAAVMGVVLQGFHQDHAAR
jgi:hypothetical protein